MQKLSTIKRFWLRLSTLFLLFVLFFYCNYAFSSSINSSEACVNCHQEQHRQWQQSDHAKSMAIADNLSVVGNFNQQQVTHYGQQARFFIAENKFMATVTYDDKSETYPIKYTFGYYPLQQYLVETEPGRFQVLPFAWDARPVEEGGQRWYHNYSNEEIRRQDRLHWRQPLQNWNGMCSDCHSDGLVRNYNVEKNTFDTKWHGVNVGCMSCHGEMFDHANQTKENSTTTTVNDLLQNRAASGGKWLRKSGQKTAHWQGNKRDNSFMDNCFSCHALRSPLTDGFKAGKGFLDQFTPQLLNPPMYHADGQIKEEVYVYGSFLQSKMFAAGVNCLDCHDKHTMKLKIAGNGLCLQCHSSDAYDTTSHHQHQKNSSGSQCVNCHMPDNRYMGVDDRRDHSFKIPRPDISIKFSTPNACVQCHEKQNPKQGNEWALQVLTNWNGKSKALSATRQNYYLLHSGQRISLKQHLAIISDEQLDVITRATALQLLVYSTNTLSSAQLRPYLSHTERLLRLAAATTATLLPVKARAKLVAPLLKDPLKAIRVAAARSLIDSQVSPQDMPLFRQAFNELQLANDISSWRGEGRLNKGIIEIQGNQLAAAEQSFVSAINIDPYFEAGYINLGDFYRAEQRPAQVVSVLIRGMSRLPNSGALRYSYGLHLVRQQQRDKATSYFEQAMLLVPESAQYVYTYVLSLDSQQKTGVALNKLKKLIVAHPGSQQLKELGLYLAKKEKNQQAYLWFSQL